MATHDYVIANQGFPAFRSDLNNALAAIVSNNSSATEPTTMFAHMIWVDTAANPSVLKIRNADNDAWITIGTINQTGDTFTLTSAVSATTLNTSGAVVFNDAGADVDFRVEGDTDANLLFVDASADKIGIGTNAPSEILHLKSATADKPVILLENTTSNDTATGNAPSIRFYSNDSNQAGIPDNAELGILEFRGDDKDGGSNRNYAQIKGLAADPGGTYKGAITFSTSNGAVPAERMRITSTGNVGIGTTSAGSKLTIIDNTSPRISCSGSGGTKANGATLVIPITGQGGCIVMVHNARTAGANAFTSTVFAVCGRAGQGYTVTQLSTKDGDVGKSFTLAANGSNAELLYTNTAGENCDVTFSVIGM